MPMHLHLGALVALVVLCSSVSSLSLGRVYWNFPNPRSPFNSYNPHPSTDNYPLHLHFPIPDGTPVDQLYVYIRSQGDWNGYYDNLRFYFNTISGPYAFIIMDNHWYDGQTINGNFINPDPFGNVYECYLPYDGVAANRYPYPGPSCAGGVIKVFDDGLQTPYYNYGGNEYQYSYNFYSAFSTQGIFPQGLTDNILLGYPGTTISNNKIYGGVVDFIAYFNGVGSNYYFFMAVGLGAAGFGGDPHLTTVFGDTLDFGEGIWSIAQKEHFAVNAKVANFYTREVAVISSDSQNPFALHIITKEDSSVTVLLDDEEIALNSIHFDGRLRYSDDIQNSKQVAGALPRYWLSEIVVRLGAEVLTFHIADHPTAGTLIEMIYEEIFTGDADLQVRDTDEPSGLLFMPSTELHERSMANLERYRLFTLM